MWVAIAGLVVVVLILRSGAGTLPPCPRCATPLVVDHDGSLRMNPVRDASGLPAPGGGLWSEGYRCVGCGALLARVHRVGETMWEDRSVQPWRRLEG